LAIVAGLGTKLAYSTDSGSTYVPVTARISIDGPSAEWQAVDSTHMDSTVVTDRQNILDPGELSFKAFYDPTDTSHVEMTTLLTAGGTVKWKLTWAGQTTHFYVFDGWLKSFGTSSEVNSNLTYDASIRLTSTISVT
jgi:hypothetical protein